MVVKEVLTDAMIEAGAALIRKLDETGLPVTTALWFFDVEITEWRLLIGSPDVDSAGPFIVYGKVFAAISELGEAMEASLMPAISLLSANADLARRLKTELGPHSGIDRIRMKRNVADGRYIDDALVYRAA